MQDVAGLILAGDYSIISLVLGFVGSLLLTLFGLPPIGILNTGMYVQLEFTWQIWLATAVSRVGLLLVAASFFMQLCVQLSKAS